MPTSWLRAALASGRLPDPRVPDRLAGACRLTAERSAWLERLPARLDDLTRRWSLELGPPFEEASAAWVAPAARADGTPCVLKLGMPHFEGEHELAGLRFWDGDPTVRLLEANEEANAMLLERCRPGTPLRALPEAEQDAVLAHTLRRIWRPPLPNGPFRELSVLTAYRSEEVRAKAEPWLDAGLVQAGLELLEELSRTASTSVLLATDLHAGNVLRAEREPWLVIDPKPFVGDPAYDATQHLLNCRARLGAAPLETIRRFAALTGLEPERVRLWSFARMVTEEEWWSDPDLVEVARSIGP